MPDIALAASKGIDAFALNIGSNDWEPTQVSSAYAAALQMATPFKLFLSFDMTSLPCSSAADSQLIRQYIGMYATHPNQLLYDGQVFISTFAGQTCTFGASSVNQGWINTVKTGFVPSTYFVPSFFVDPATFSNYSVLDGAFGVRVSFVQYFHLRSSSPRHSGTRAGRWATTTSPSTPTNPTSPTSAPSPTWPPSRRGSSPYVLPPFP